MVKTGQRNHGTSDDFLRFRPLDLGLVTPPVPSPRGSKARSPGVQVTHLNASMNPIGDAGAKHLAALLAETQLPLARHLMPFFEAPGWEHQQLQDLVGIRYRYEICIKKEMVGGWP